MEGREGGRGDRRVPSKPVPEDPDRHETRDLSGYFPRRWVGSSTPSRRLVVEEGDEVTDGDRGSGPESEAHDMTSIPEGPPPGTEERTPRVQSVLGGPGRPGRWVSRSRGNKFGEDEKVCAVHGPKGKETGGQERWTLRKWERVNRRREGTKH